MPTSLMDNDVLHKATAYGLLATILATPPACEERYGILGTARYVVGKKLKKRPPTQRPYESVIADFNELLKQLKELEPLPEEVDAAAALEYQAQRLNLELDAGESLLCAIMVSRKLNHLLTGDKRAIGSVEVLINTQNISGDLAKKFIFLEQLVLMLAGHHGVQIVRAAVCSEKQVDTGLTSCFSCYSPEVADGSCIEGLKSYISHLRQSAPLALAQDA